MKLRVSVSLALAAFLMAGCEKSSDSSNNVFFPFESELEEAIDVIDERSFGDNDPRRVLALGDSVTAGSAISGPSYPALVASFSGKQVFNEGVGGTMSNYGLNHIGSLLGAYQPGYVMILYGINDIIHVNDPGWTVTNLRDMVRAARANRTVPIVGTLPPRARDDVAWDPRHTDLNVRIRAMAEEENVRLADIERVFNWDRNLLQADGFHPNETGNRLIAVTFHALLDDEP